MQPIQPFDGDFKSTLCTRDLKRDVGKAVTILGYLIAIKHTSTSKGQRINFGTSIDIEAHFIDTVHFPQQQTRPFRGRGVYTITGKVVEEYDFASIEVMMMDTERYMDDPR